MSGHYNYEPSNGFTKWLDTRLPLVRFAQETVVQFPTPKNLNWWYVFGAILSVMLMIQIITGIILAMHYEASVEGAFASVERIMRDVNYGWLLRYIHANGASFFFLAVYLHMFRGLYYGSYKAPREILWILGCVIYLLMAATAFLGYMLPWGQMSLHGANVIINLFGAVPWVGDAIQTWLQGGPSVGDQTLKRFFSLHYLLPFMIAGVVVLHIWALHVPGNNNPTGVEVKDVEKETVPFHPFYTVKDGVAVLIWLMIFAFFVFFAPNVLGHADNYIEANPLVTPAHIVPEWYLLPFYAILRAITFSFFGIDAKLLGVIAMVAAIFVLFLLPWLDTSKIKSLRYRPVARQFFMGFVATCLILGWCGATDGEQPVVAITADKLVVVYQDEGEGPARRIFEDATDAFAFRDSLPQSVTSEVAVERGTAFRIDHLNKIGTTYYFAYFFLILPLLGLMERVKSPPKSIEDSIHEA